MAEKQIQGRERVKILIVDDESSIRAFLQDLLEYSGYDCRAASNAEEALTELQKNDYALVLSDILMPGMDGVAFLERVRSGEKEIAVIMLTALGEVEYSIRCLKAGAYDYLTKPFTISQVLTSMEKALEKRRLILENLDYQRNLEEKVRLQSAQIQTSFLQTIEALSYALEAKDRDLRDHSQRVTACAVQIAREMGFPFAEVEKIRVAALLHDIGKLGVNDKILDKKQELEEEEIEHIQRHPLVAGRLLGPISQLKEIIELIKHHHESFDGCGYPDGLREEEIPLGARILAVADAFDAMTSSRPYRKTVSLSQALDELRRKAGKQFDPAVVDVISRLISRDAVEGKDSFQ